MATQTRSKATPTSSSLPVHSLRETATALEAAVLECLEKPRKAAVHKVRTSTRRIEAQLNLLPLAGGFPAIDAEADRMRKILKKLRGAAGDVRDLDVQIDLVDQEATTNGNASTATFAKEAKRLAKALSKRREKEADRLIALLEKQHAKLPRTLRELLDPLEESDGIAIPEPQLIRLVRQWYQQGVEPHWRGAEKGDVDELHAVRKIAKVARYLAETAPETAAKARHLANHFETIQQAGGQWHDWLLLTQAANDELGRSAELSGRFSTHADEALADFRHRIGYRM